MVCRKKEPTLHVIVKIMAFPAPQLTLTVRRLAKGDWLFVPTSLRSLFRPAMCRFATSYTGQMTPYSLNIERHAGESDDRYEKRIKP